MQTSQRSSSNELVSICIAVLCVVSPALRAADTASSLAPANAPGWQEQSESAGGPANRMFPARDIDIPPGTILPIRLNSLSSDKSKKGDVIKARIMQDVPLENGAKLRAGWSVLGHVLEASPATPGNKALLSIGFDTVLHGNHRIPIHTHLRALASTLEVEFAQVPTTGAGESDVYEWLPTTQIGGEVVYGKGGEVFNGDRMVGRSVNDGILARANAKEGSECHAAVDGNDRPQAMWVFSSDACGAYGFPNLIISDAGRTNPQGAIVLISNRGPAKIRSGSGMLLRVQR